MIACHRTNAWPREQFALTRTRRLGRACIGQAMSGNFFQSFANTDLSWGWLYSIVARLGWLRVLALIRTLPYY